MLTGAVKSASTCAPIAGATVSIGRHDQPPRLEVRTDADGRWGPLDCETGEWVHFEAEGFVSKRFLSDDPPPLVRLLENRLCGYQDRLYYRAGDRITVHWHGPNAVTPRLFRHGIEKALIAEWPQQDPHSQSVPDGYFVDRGLDWTFSFEYVVPDSARPGLFSLDLTSAGGERFAIPFAVVSSKPTGSLLVLVSTTTWLAYNFWGGRSRYRSAENSLVIHPVPAPGGPTRLQRLRGAIAACLPEPLVDFIRFRILGRKAVDDSWKWRRLSVNRPFPHCDLEHDDVASPFINHLGGAEWRVLAWLEREGIEYDLAAAEQLEREPGLLDGYRAVMLNSHCEYWSREMFAELERAHEHGGVWILNIGGNSVYREVVLNDDSTMSCRGEGFAQTCADETRILAARLTLDDFSTCAPYAVQKPDHWVFEGAGIAADGVFGRESLNRDRSHDGPPEYDPGRPGTTGRLLGSGASGWETDKLSDTAPADAVVVASGMNHPRGADMVVRDAGGTRGGLLQVSSITFGGALLIDDVCSAIARNVLSRALGDG